MTLSSATEAVLELAQRPRAEEEQLQDFIESLRELVSNRQFSWDGEVCTLAEYLDRRSEQPDKGSGDEHPVVDRLVRQILESLGYSEQDFVYNQRLPGVGTRAVPDYTVYVRDVLSTPVFVVESKATTVASFAAPVTRRGEAESPLEQLRRYVLSGVVHGRVGLLCNGFRLEAWEFAGSGDMRLASVDLHALACGSGDESEALTMEQRTALRTLWSRFSRASFVRAHDLREVSGHVPPLPPEWLERVQEKLRTSGRADSVEDDLVAYYEEVWEESAIDVSDTPEQLVDSLRGLIEHFAEDVLHQLAEALRRYAEYEAAARALDAAARSPQIYQRLELRQQNFDLSQEAFEEVFLQPLKAWSDRPRLENQEAKIQEWVAALGPHVKPDNGLDIEQLELDPAQRPNRESKANGLPSRKKRVLQDLGIDLERYTEAVLEELAERKQLDDEYRAARRVADAYETWSGRVSSSVLVGASQDVFRREFARQTAYVYIVRLLLVRICEDKGLFQRKISDGGLVLWKERASRYLDYASGQSYEYLTRMAYECAQNVYVHFYGASELFDWYRMDEKVVIRALLVLNVFNLKHIDTDIIGAVYGRYLEEGKHEQGRYYTPRALVRAMLDMAGYRGDTVVNRRIADLACGSGSFLVEACRRLLDQFRGSDGTIPTAKLRPALEEVQRSLYGVEINPFACYLAETNLLIQVLDLVRQAQKAGVTLTVDRFRIYSGDSLIVAESLAASKDTALMLLGEDRGTLELLKARTGPFEEGFDFLVGNPPYVRADEDAPAYLAYRKLLEWQDWFTTRYLKWDLYVPFVEQYRRLLSDQSTARCCLVTIESIKSAPYATKLRELLARDSTLHEILFTRDLQLFEDASWQDNVIFSFSRPQPPDGHRVRRQVVQERTEDGSLQVEPLDEPEQVAVPADQIFRLREQVDLDLSNTVQLETLCYVSKGMVLHSHEKLKPGQEIHVGPGYEPREFGEEIIEDLGKQGKRIRHSKFRREDLIADEKDELHSRPYLDPRELLRGGIGKVQWIEYGENGRCPARVSRPTFPELYDRPKLLLGTFAGVAVDEGSRDDYLVASHSITLAILWHRLDGVENRSLSSARQALGDEGIYEPKLSRKYSEWYLCALALSEPIQQWLYANKRSMKEHVYPDDVRAIPIKQLGSKQQKPFVALEKERHGLWRELVALEARGFRITDKTVEVPVRELAEGFRKENPDMEHLTFVQMPSTIFEISEGAYDVDLRSARAVSGEVRIGHEPVLRVGEKIERRDDVAELLARYVSDLPGTLADRQEVDALPRTEEGLLALAAYLDEEEEAVRRRQRRIRKIQEEIDEKAWALYGFE